MILTPEQNDLLIDGILMLAVRAPTEADMRVAADLMERLAETSGVTVENVEEFPRRLHITVERRTGEHKGLSDRHIAIVLVALQTAWIFMHPDRTIALDLLERIAVESGLKEADFRSDTGTVSDMFIQLARAINIVVEPVLEGQEPATH